MSDVFNLKVGDTLPALAATLLTTDGSAVPNLDTATVEFRMCLKGSDTAVVEAAATVVDADTGEVQYEWATEDTATIAPGDYEAEFIVTSAAGVQTVPSKGYIKVKVNARA